MIYHQDLSTKLRLNKGFFFLSDICINIVINILIIFIFRMYLLVKVLKIIIFIGVLWMMYKWIYSHILRNI